MESKGGKNKSKGKTKVQKASKEREKADTSKTIQKKTDLGTEKYVGKEKRKMTDSEGDRPSSKPFPPFRDSSESESSDECTETLTTSTLDDTELTTSDTSEDTPQLTLTSTSDSESDEAEPGGSQENDAEELKKPTERSSDKAHSSAKNQRPFFWYTPSDSTERPPPDSEDDSGSHCSLPSFIKPLLAKDKVEGLLFESFCLKYLEGSLTSSDSDVDVQFVGAVKNGKGRQSRRSSGPGGGRLRRSASGSPVADDPPVEVTGRDQEPESSCSDNTRQGERRNFSDSDWTIPFMSPEQPEEPAATLVDSDVEILDFLTDPASDAEQWNVSPPLPQPGHRDPLPSVSGFVPKWNELTPKGKSTPGWECPICYEKSTGQDVVATQCGHIFCKNCLESYFASFSERCPACRANLTMKPPILLFNI